MWKYFNTNNNKRVGKGGPKLTLHTSLCRDLKLIEIKFKTVNDYVDVTSALKNVRESKNKNVICDQIVSEKLRIYEHILYTYTFRKKQPKTVLIYQQQYS